MERGRFSYAHLDLMLTRGGEYWLTEINLRGGLKGAKISGEVYRQKIETIHKQLLDKIKKGDIPTRDVSFLNSNQ